MPGPIPYLLASYRNLLGLVKATPAPPSFLAPRVNYFDKDLFAAVAANISANFTKYETEQLLQVGAWGEGRRGQGWWAEQGKGGQRPLCSSSTERGVGWCGSFGGGVEAM